MINSALILAVILSFAGAYFIVAAINGALQADADRRAARAARHARLYKTRGGAR